MRLGLYLDLRNPTRQPPPDHFARALVICEEGEALGADSIWLSEHHGFDDDYLPQPLTFAAAVAARTRRVRIGTAILLADLRHPAQLLEEAAIVDILSSGRLDLGLGAGYRTSEFELFDRRPPSREKPLAQLFASRRALRDLLASARVTPAPVQDPFPLWLGCNGPRGARTVGRLGEHLLSARADLWPEYRAGLVEGGHDAAAARMSGPVNMFLADNPDDAREVVARAYGYLWDSYARANAEGTGRPAPPPTDTARALEGGLTAGLRGLVIARPEDAAQLLLEHFRDVPIDTLFTWAMIPYVPDALMARHRELWSTELRPLLISGQRSLTSPPESQPAFGR